MTEATDLSDVAGVVERLKGPFPVCPFDRRSPDYWTAGNNGEPCPACGATEAIEDAKKCPGADTRVLDEAAQALTTLASDNKALGEERDEARRRLAASLTAAAKAWETAGVDALGIDRTHLFRRENDDPAEYEALLRAARRATDAELRAESAEARVKALEEAIRPFVTRFVDRTALPDTTILSVRRFNTDARLAYEQPMFTVGDLRRARAALSAQEGKE